MRQYEQRRPLYQQLAEEVVYILRKALSEKSVETSDIVFRIKDFESFYGKILRKEFTEDIFNLIEDVAGVRIICLYRPDLGNIENIIREKFDVTKAELLRDRSIGQFGYMSDHYIVKLPPSYKGERYDAVKSLRCEIQVRTIAMHAWASVAHHLDYKQEFDIPSNLKSDFYALSGVFQIADSLFEQFRKAREESVNVLMKKTLGEKFDLSAEMNLDTMFAYLCWKFPDRETSDMMDVSNMLSILRKAKISNYKELDKIIDLNMKWLLASEKEDPPHVMKVESEGEKKKIVHKRGKFRPIGVIRMILRERLKKIGKND
jgi:ppGpp synthetase/RelA/SpoT-type nucleotidyltranferase